MWTAGRNFDEDTPISVFHSLLGAKMLPEHIKRDVPEIHHDTDEESIPDSFDARIQWHNCKVISNVGDQSACAASWVRKLCLLKGRNKSDSKIKCYFTGY